MPTVLAVVWAKAGITGLGAKVSYTEQDKTEMDFADASLYWLAADTGVTKIMTTDRRDFERYRLPDGRGFEIV